MSASRANRWLGATLGCAATLGLFEAARALAGGPRLTAAESLVLVVWCVGGYAAAGLAALAAVYRWLTRRGAAGTPPGRGPLAAAGALASGVLVAVLELRVLAGFALPRLLVFVPACLAAGAAAALATGWLLERIAPRRQRLLWRSLAALGAAALLVAWIGRAWPVARRTIAAEATRPNILLISIDTLRADRLGTYGGRTGLTPQLDRFAAESALLEDAVSPIALTGPSHTSMLTGLYPVHHGATLNGLHPRPGVETIAEALARAGYRTAAFVGGWPLTDLSSGLARHFDHYDENLGRPDWFPRALQRVPLLWLVDRAVMFLRYAGGNADSSGIFQGELFERPGELTASRALRWIESGRERPFFAFVHFYEPHGPYAPPQEFRRQVDPDYDGSLDAFDRRIGRRRVAELFADPRAVRRIAALYDGEVAHVDAVVGELLDGLARLGRAADTLVVVTADHGESLTEHGEYFGHDDLSYEETLHVPLLIRLPDRRFSGRRYGQQVRLIDLAPTLLELARLRAPAGLDGASLVPLLEDREAAERIAFGSHETGGPGRRSRHYVRARGHKLIWTLDTRADPLDGPPQEELYDLRSDPGELRDLLRATPPAIGAELRALLAEWVAARGGARTVADPEVARHLRSLGYL